jgi:hypothetical protein
MAWANGNGFDSFQSGHGPLGQEFYEKDLSKNTKTMNQMNLHFNFSFRILVVKRRFENLRDCLCKCTSSPVRIAVVAEDAKLAR